MTRALIIFVIAVHFMFFILEAVFWMQPFVYNILLDFLNNPVDLAHPVQAITLRNLFINQGFYNLFLVIAGLKGLHLLSQKKYAVGYGLILFLCFAGVGAGIVLACSTKAYLLAIVQGIPAAITFYKVYSFYKLTPTK